MKTIRRIAAFALALAMTLSLGCAAQGNTLENQLDKTAQYLLRTVSDPQVSGVGGEWTVLGLARSGLSVSDEYFAGYYQNLEQTVSECAGVLHERKYNVYSRVILALSAIGKDPTDVAGYDLLKPLGDFDQTVWQGVNGAIWALIALDSAEYDVPRNENAETQATRQLYVDAVLDAQLPDGGWAIGASSADSDLTAMALQALAAYQDQDAVSAAIEAGLSCLSAIQHDDGSFDSFGSVSSESCAQVLVALSTLGISVDDARFVKNEKSVLDALLTFANRDGSFRHTLDGESDLLATEQAFYAMVAVLRAQNGQDALYRMRDDAITVSDSVPAGTTQAAAQNASATGEDITCTVSISCATILDNLAACDPEKLELVPEDGQLLAPTEVSAQAGESVFDVLQRVCRENRLHLEFSNTPVYNSAYIEGIGNLYEFDVGNLSGWMYSVNGWFPNYGCSNYQVQDGDVIAWQYTCDLGADIGGSNAASGE